MARLGSKNRVEDSSYETEELGRGCRKKKRPLRLESSDDEPDLPDEKLSSEDEQIPPPPKFSQDVRGQEKSGSNGKISEKKKSVRQMKKKSEKTQVSFFFQLLLFPRARHFVSVWFPIRPGKLVKLGQEISKLRTCDNPVLNLSSGGKSAIPKPKSGVNISTKNQLEVALWKEVKLSQNCGVLGNRPQLSPQRTSCGLNC